MLDNAKVSTAANNSLGTSAHETGIILSSLSFNSNALRYYTPTGTRHRKASGTTTMRSVLCSTMLAAYPDIRRIKIKDCGILFSARIWMRSGRVIHQKAYSLQNLSGLLREKLELMQLLPV